MKEFLINYLYIFGTIFFTVYGQLVIKWQMSKAGPLPLVCWDKISFLLVMFFRPWVLSAFISAFLAALCWMAAVSKFNLSYAYPFMSGSFVLVLILSCIFFQEPINLPKILGIALILSGIAVSAQG